VTAAQRLAAEMVAARDRELPRAVVARANALLKDYLGVAVGGAVEESSITLRRGLRALGVDGRGTVVGTAERFAVPHAALANGAAAHALEMDDTHQGGSIHLAAPIFPAALAAAELVDVPGRRVLAAVVAGYEVAARLAMALGPSAHYERGFHPTGTCGAFGAATAAALVLGLDAAGVATAIGIAGSQASGSMEFLADGAWTKRLHPGWSASAGLHAATLAQAGFRAPATILEGRFGFLHAYSNAGDAAKLAGAGDWELCQTSIKPHACCRYMQGPIDAILALRAAHRLDPADVERIEVGMLATGFPIVCEPADAKARPQSQVELQFSLPFGIAVALVSGAAGPDRFQLSWRDDPAVQRLLPRVVAVRDDALDARFPREWPCWVRTHVRGARVHTHAVSHPKGDAGNFLSDAELDAKFAALAGRALADVGPLRSAIDAFPDASSAHALLAAAVPGVT
jgi:2-methylcitrate dehydratase PrpD